MAIARRHLLPKQLEANGLTRCPPKDGREQSTSTEVPRAKVAL